MIGEDPGYNMCLPDARLMGQSYHFWIYAGNNFKRKGFDI